jgi:hypothetical protein
MRNRISLVAVVALAALVSVAWITTPAAQESIEGTWIDTSEDDSNQRAVFLFTSDGSYSMMFVRGDEARAEPNEDWTDADALSSFREITANSGRVTIDGNEINYEAYMANSTAYMNRWPDNDQAATFELNGDMMTLTLAGQTFHLRRPN